MSKRQPYCDNESERVVAALSEVKDVEPSEEAGILRRRLASHVCGNIYSEATGKWYR